MDIRTLLQEIKKEFDAEKIQFALIGGLAVGSLGYQRFTNDIDMLIHEDDKEKAKNLLLKKGYTLFSENSEFVQFQGQCPLDIQLARRPISKKMLADAQMLTNTPVRCLRVEDLIGLKIQAFSTNSKREFKRKRTSSVHFSSLDWAKIKNYADLFSKGTKSKPSKLRSMLMTEFESIDGSALTGIFLNRQTRSHRPSGQRCTGTI